MTKPGNSFKHFLAQCAFKGFISLYCSGICTCCMYVGKLLHMYHLVNSEGVVYLSGNGLDLKIKKSYFEDTFVMFCLAPRVPFFSWTVPYWVHDSINIFLQIFCWIPNKNQYLNFAIFSTNRIPTLVDVPMNSQQWILSRPFLYISPSAKRRGQGRS